MNHKNWYIGAGVCLVSAVLFAGCTAWAAKGPAPVLDAAGLTFEEAVEPSLPEQFANVAERYRALNDLVADTQKQLEPGEWIDASTTNPFMTLAGDEIGGNLGAKAKKDNSYYIRRSWDLAPVLDSDARIDRARAFWESNGWSSARTDSEITPGNYRVTTTTPDGTWLALDLMDGEITLTAFSGVYWGDREALSNAIWNIQQNERNEGIEWWPERVNEDGNGLIRPGEYPPYPAWNEVAYEEHLEMSPHWDRRGEQAAQNTDD
ncbi:hypothetical protein ACXR2W_01535 [Leucobacter sp. HY1908]